MPRAGDIPVLPKGCGTKLPFAAKIGAYAQGFAVIAEASREFNWSLSMPVIATIWRAGCIIRSQFLDEITSAFTKAPDAANLIVTPAFSKMVKESLPALTSALTYFDAYRQGRGTANLIQAQRDFFGAHGFDRLDGKDFHHGPWGSGAATF